MDKNHQISDRLRLWQGRLKRSESSYQEQLDRMNKREALYRGDRELAPLVEGELKQEIGRAHV